MASLDFGGRQRASRQRRVYLVPPARWRSDRSAASFDWSNIGPAPRLWADKPPPAADISNVGGRRLDWSETLTFAISSACRCNALLRTARAPIAQASVSVAGNVLAAHRRWMMWNAVNRRRTLTTLCFCTAAGVMAVPLVAGVAHSQPEFEGHVALSSPVKAKALAERAAVPANTSPLPTKKWPDVPSHVAQPAAAAAKRPLSSPSSIPLLSDVSTMDLMMPIAEPDLNIASHHSLWAQVGRESGVDPLLLYSVALVESRSLHPGGDVGPTPWLFRVNDHLVTGERHHVQMEMAAATQFNAGVQDVGIMQVYYPMHRSAVRDPLTLLDPKTNISVAARILHDGMHETRDPVLGVGYYHSHTQQLARDYGIAVMTVYQRLKDVYRSGKSGQVVAR